MALLENVYTPPPLSGSGGAKARLFKLLAGRAPTPLQSAGLRRPKQRESDMKKHFEKRVIVVLMKQKRQSFELKSRLKNIVLKINLQKLKERVLTN